MNADDVFARCWVGQRNENLRVEAPLAETRIQTVDVVRSSDDDQTRNTPVLFKGVHQLRNNFTMVGGGMIVTRAGDGVDLIEEEHDGNVLSREFEQLLQV